MRPVNDRETPLNQTTCALFNCVKTLLLLVAMTLVATSHAGTDDRSKPINIKADKSEFDQRSGVQIFKGNVQISQGSMSIRADSIRIETSDSTNYKIIGLGNPIKFQQTDDDSELLRGQSDKIVYDTANSQLLFEGNASFERPGQIFSGHRIEYSLSNLTFSASSNDKKRVNIVLQPVTPRQ